MKKVAVLILNWNGEKILREFLPSVVEFTTNPDVELCVVDNASTDNSVEMTSALFPTVRVIQLDKNYGYADGYNKSIEQVNAEYVLLLNSDVQVTSHWLDNLVDYMDEHPEVAACQPKILSFRDKTRFEYAGAAGGFIDKLGYPYCRGRIFDELEEDNGQYDNIIPIFWASGAALMVRRQDYLSVGGLDGRFFAHMEEIDLCWRLNSRGKKIVCIPQSIVYHVGGATLKVSPEKTYLNFRNNYLMLYKNCTESNLRFIFAVRALLDRLAMLLFYLKGESANAQAIKRAKRDFKHMKINFAASRIDNLLKATNTQFKQAQVFSIVLSHYFFFKKHFSQL